MDLTNLLLATAFQDFNETLITPFQLESFQMQVKYHLCTQISEYVMALMATRTRLCTQIWLNIGDSYATPFHIDRSRCVGD